ncbi:MAG: hypothetical protein ACR2OY_14235 [Boseongicola sp.]
MKQANSQVTLLVGPQTRLARALNDAVRTRRAAIAAAGVTAFPSRIATRALRAAMGNDMRDDKKQLSLAAELSLHEGRPVFLSAINLLGGPAAAFYRRELFPNAEQMIAGPSSALTEIVSRVVTTIEPLHHFLLSLRLPTLHQRVADSPWEALYELSWSDLVSEICEAFPTSQVLVLTPDAAFVNASNVLAELFGVAGERIDPAHIQRPHLTPNGQVALSSIQATNDPAPDVLEELLAAHRDMPDAAELKARTGIDNLTSTLLEQRFLEDLQDLESLPNVRLL